MSRYGWMVVLAVAALPAAAQGPTPEELAFSRLPVELQAALRHLPPGEALRKVTIARENLIALGTPQPTTRRLVATVDAVLAPGDAAVRSVSAGESSFPPLSPLVAPVSYERR